MKVIINADDFGINEVVTSEIERMIEAGAISSTTIMANGSCLDEVKRFAILHPEISYGIHLCLSEFSSITKSEVLYRYGLTDEKGTYIKDAIFGMKSFPSDLKQAIKEELMAQIQIVKSLEIPISHIDSHHHVHNIYHLHKVLDEVMHTCGYNKIRLGIKVEPFKMFKVRFLSKHSENSQPKDSIKTEVKQENKSLISRVFSLLNATINRYRLNSHLKSQYITADRFFSYSTFYSVFEQGKVLDSNRVFELMCHPGHPGLNYRNEMMLVETKKLIKNPEVKLITYNDLH